MSRMRLVTLLVFAAISIPVLVLGWTSLSRQEQEGRAELAFFCSTLLDRIGEELNDVLLEEEMRAVSEFVPDRLDARQERPFIMARAELAPDGTVSLAARPATGELRHAAWKKALQAGHPLEAPTVSAPPSKKEQPAQNSLETKYFARSKAAPQPRTQQKSVLRLEPSLLRDEIAAEQEAPAESVHARPETTELVEIDPFQVLALEGTDLFLFRRIQRGNTLLRQGIIIDGPLFLDYLLQQTYRGQPIADDTGIALRLMNGSETLVRVSEGTEHSPLFVQERVMHRPFNFLQARVEGFRLPMSGARMTLLGSLIGVALALTGGFAALLRSVRMVEVEARRRSGFVSSVTHELKTPLANIRLYMEMLEQGMASTPERERQYYATLFAETDRLGRLISNILEFSKLQSRTRTLACHTADPADVLNRVREVMAPQVEQSGFALTVRHEPCSFSLDPEALLQILLNLVENSLKFGRDAAERRIMLTSGPQGHRVRITVSDTGPGIPARDIDRVFDDFFRCEDELTRTTTGTGIGLALARRLSGAMNGTIRVRNNPDAGCTFTLDFPAA